ncbi:hypothetical protein Patl1_19496 [Pistacia atlantica]|uniref:Uncharacterized protein n=1 Tax=Pistacia atlantica TaxID=434234 RepID=A0ACC1C0A4_9ROSI|nr:hypothetical protein Patl1_19496 [Pistacia atlantica]
MDVMASMEARVMRNEVNVAEVKEHLNVLDQKMDDGVTSSSGRVPIGSGRNQGDWAFCKKAMANGFVTNAAPPARVKVPKPLKYGGKWDAQELENFLWSMERYFDATNVQSELDRVNIATGYLEDHAIAWWKRKHAEIVQGTCIINTWELLKCEIKKQFYQGNVAYEARKKMRELKHTGPISKYVDEFSKLMLQVDNMNSKDLLFNFIEGLQPWAQRELQRCQVANISIVLTEANTLVEFCKGEPSKSKKDGKLDYSKGGGEEGVKSSHHKEKGDKSPHKKEWQKNDCPKHKAFNAMFEERKPEAPASETANMGCLQLLNALKVKPAQPKV